MQPTSMLPKLTDSKQTISFSEGDGVCSAEVFANNVVVTTNAGNHNHGSSKVKLKNLVDYNWEPKFYSGNLLAVHMSGKYLAYCIKAPNTMNPGSWSGMVRVVYNPEMGNDRRALIKGMKGEVQDLAFAHILNQVVLACIDEHGNFYVHEIELTDSGLRCTLVCEIRSDTQASGPHRVVWCPYIPDDHDAEPDDVARLLLTTHDNKARMWNISLVVAALAGSEGRGVSGALGGGSGCVAAGEHGAAIVDAAFSPDGTALATAAKDGLVMFYQVYTHSERTPRCLHKWQPHGGAPLSCLAFLDNYNNTDTDVQYWKFAVTGAENNTVLKIWSCKSWNCLQTITFTPTMGSEPTLGLKAMLDSSANYMLLSDFKTRSLYVLNMARDRDDTTAYCKSISEFLLSYPVLSFYIFDAEEVQAKCESSCDEPFHRNGCGDDVGDSPEDFDLHDDGTATGGAAARRARLRLYIVQPKGLQEAELVYEPPQQPSRGSEVPEVTSLLAEEESVPALASSILQQQSQQLKNLLMRSQTQPGSLISQRPESPPAIPQPLNLMTPDAFSSPGKRDEDDPPLSATPDVSKPRMSTGSIPTEGASEPAGKFTSGGSSPSREVQEIMSHNDDDTYYKGNMEEEEEEEPAQPAAEAVSPAASFSAPAALPTLPTLPALPEPPALPDLPTLPTLPQLPALPPLPVSVPVPVPSNDTSWPQISLAQITEANQRKASSDKSGSQSLNNSAALSCDRPPSVSPRRDALELKIDQLTEQVTSLSRTVTSLRSTLGVSMPTLVRQACDEALQAHAPRTAAAIDQALTLGWERIARLGETASARAASAAGVGAARALEPLAAALQHELAAKLSATDALLADNIQKLVTSKVQSTAAARALEPLAAALQHELAAKLSATDALLADNIQKLVTSKVQSTAAARALEPLAAALQHELAAKLSATDALLADNIQKLVTSKVQSTAAARALEPLAAALQHELAAKLSATDALLADNIQKLVTSKVQSTAAARALEPLAAALQHELAAKLSATDALLADNIQKLVTSKVQSTAAARALEPLAAALQHELAAKLSATDALLADNIQKLVTSKVQSTAAARALEPLAAALQHELAAKLSATDALLADNIQKLVTSKVQSTAAARALEPLAAALQHELAAKLSATDALLADNIQKLVTSKVQSTAAARALEPLAAALQHELAAKLSATDALLADNIQKLVTSKVQSTAAARALEPLAAALQHELAAKLSATDALLADNIQKLVTSKVQSTAAARALEPLAAALQHELAAKLSATDALLADNIQKLVTSKVQSTAAARALEPLAAALQHELAAKLSATDALLADNIQKLVTSKVQSTAAARALEPLAAALQHELAAKLSATDALLADNIQKLVTSKVQSTAAARALEPLAAALQHELAAKLSATDALLADNIQKLVTSKVQSTAAARALEPLAAALQHELAAKLSATDALLADNIQKLVTSKSVTDRLSAAVSSCVTTAVRDAFRDAMRDSVVPAVERAHQDMFRQVNLAFQQGTKEFSANTEAVARLAVERGTSEAVTSLRTALTRHANALCAAPPPLNQNNLAAMLRDTVRPVLEKEVEWWARQARSVHMSRAHSPATPAGSSVSAHDRQMQVAQITSLMGTGDVNGAFQLALSASDLTLVMCACRAADPARVFAPPCQLRQHVLLSLVQQLAADMGRDTALKHRYLEEAIMNLDTSNAVTREHLPVVVRELQKQVMAFLASNPGHALARKFKMLMIVADSLAKGPV